MTQDHRFTFPHVDRSVMSTGYSVEAAVNAVMHEIHKADRAAGEAWKWRYTATVQERVWCGVADRISATPARWSELVKDGDRMVVRRWTSGGEVTITGDFYEGEPVDEWSIRFTRVRIEPGKAPPVDQHSRFGPIGRIAAVSGNAITLCDRSDVENFSPGLEIAVSWKDRCRPNDPDLRPGRVVIRSVDPAIGVVFATAPLWTAISTATSMDWIYRCA